MMDPIEIIEINQWHPGAGAHADGRATQALESGKVLFFPRLGFALEPQERAFLSPQWSDGQAKNISFDPVAASLRHAAAQGQDGTRLAAMLARFVRCARALVTGLCPGYGPHLRSGLTSFRPVEVEGRASSPRKDDTRLHVDAFASRPSRGERILRVFANVNPDGKPRVWEIGEPFEAVADRFGPRVPPQWPGSAWLLARLGITRGVRAPYDHVMLNLHDLAKLDEAYQRASPKARIAFPAGSAWMCYTDRVMHAALSGQHAFEQTFYLPVTAMRDERLAPLRILERQFDRALA
jgi:hypothetical protein